MIQQTSISVDEGKFHIPTDSMNYDERFKVLNHAESFGIFDLSGDIHPYAKKAQGIFHQGTRFLSRLELRMNKKKPILLGSSIKANNDIFSVDLTNPECSAYNIPENMVHISRSKFIRNAVYYEELSFMSYSDEEYPLDISLSFGADFKDLFEIRGISRTVARYKPNLSNNDHSIIFDYEGLDKIHRRTEILFPVNNECTIQNNTANFPLVLQPHHRTKINCLIAFSSEEESAAVEEKKIFVFDFEKTKTQMRQDLEEMHQMFASISTSNNQFTEWINRSKADLISLLTSTRHGYYPYAGVPWYNTAFGRDGIITAMEVLSVAPEIAKNVLLFLAKMQAKDNIPSKDAEPGKILHETRTGEMANTQEIPFREYYGTVDATPLFVMLAGMYFKHTADAATINEIWPEIKAAISWIDLYGDLDGDGFVEYKHKAENGLTNQGWKDSFDSVMYEDGSLCEPPIALCEVQGYVYAAKNYAALIASWFGEKEYAQQLTEEAEKLKMKFNQVFWDASAGYYALALDKNKKPCRVVSSNPGHCLFTGIIDPEHATSVAQTITGKDMFSGWGVRTLSAKEKRYNPMSYHNGSVWPHDNALIAMGLAKYGFPKEAMSILSALFEASLFIDMQRLPELYCGFERRPAEGPTAYPVACSPQAWSVATVFLLLQGCLNMEVNALEKTIIFIKPEMPEYVDRLTFKRLKAGEGFCEIEISRHPSDVGFNVIHKPEDWEIIVKK